MKSFNINSIVKVKLTDYGRKVLEIQHNEFWSSYRKLDKYPYIPKTRIHYLDAIDDEGRHWMAEMSHKEERWICYT